MMPVVWAVAILHGQTVRLTESPVVFILGEVLSFFLANFFNGNVKVDVFLAPVDDSDVA